MDLIVHEVPLNSSFLKDRANLVSKSALCCRRRPSRYANKSPRAEPRVRAARHTLVPDFGVSANVKVHPRRRTISDTAFVIGTYQRADDRNQIGNQKKSAVLIQTWERRSQTDNGKCEVYNDQVSERVDSLHLLNGTQQGKKTQGYIAINEVAKMPGRPIYRQPEKIDFKPNVLHTCCNGSVKNQGYLNGKSPKPLNPKPLSRPRSLHNLSNGSSNEEPEWISLSKKLCAKFIQSHLDVSSIETTSPEAPVEPKQNGTRRPTSPAKIQRIPPKKPLENGKTSFKIIADDTKKGDVPQWVNLSKKLRSKFIEEHIECEPCNEDTKRVVPPKNGLSLETTSEVRIIEKVGKKNDDITKRKTEELPEWVTLSRRLRAKFIEGHKDDPDTISLDNQLNASDLEDYLESKHRKDSSRAEKNNNHTPKNSEFRNLQSNQRSSSNGIKNQKQLLNGNGYLDINHNKNDDSVDDEKKYCYWSDIAPRQRSFTNNNGDFSKNNGLSQEYTRDMTPRTRQFFADDDVSYELTFESFETEDTAVPPENGTISSEDEAWKEQKDYGDSPSSLRDAKPKSKSMGDLMHCGNGDDVMNDDEVCNACSCTTNGGIDDIDASSPTEVQSFKKQGFQEQNSRPLQNTEVGHQAKLDAVVLTDAFRTSGTDVPEALHNGDSNRKSVAVSTDHWLTGYSDTIRIKVVGSFCNDRKSPTHDPNHSAEDPDLKVSMKSEENGFFIREHDFDSRVDGNKIQDTSVSKSPEIQDQYAETKFKVHEKSDVKVNGHTIDEYVNGNISESDHLDKVRLSATEHPDSPIYESMRALTNGGIQPESLMSTDSLMCESFHQTEENLKSNVVVETTEENSRPTKETRDTVHPDHNDPAASMNGQNFQLPNDDQHCNNDELKQSQADRRDEKIVLSRTKEFTIRKVYEEIDDLFEFETPHEEDSYPSNSKDIRINKENHYYEDIIFDSKHENVSEIKENGSCNGVKLKEDKSWRMENSHSMNGSTIDHGEFKKPSSRIIAYASVTSGQEKHIQNGIRSVELPESKSNSHRSNVSNSKQDKKKSSKSSDRLSSYQPINSPFEFETFEIPSLCSPENKMILQQHEAELNMVNGMECREVKRCESSDSDTPNSTPFDARTLMSPSSCASDSDVSSWTLTRNTSRGDNTSPVTETDCSDCSMSVKCDCTSSCSDGNIMEKRGALAQQRRAKNERKSGDSSRDPRSRFSEVFVDCETSRSWKKSRSLDHLEEKPSSVSSNFYVNLHEEKASKDQSEEAESMPESLRHIFNLPMNSIYTPAAKTSMLLSRTAEPPRSHYYSAAAAPALSSSSFKQPASKPKKSERSSSLKIKDIAQGIILTFRKFHSHSKSSSLSASVDVSHLAETNGVSKECIEINPGPVNREIRNATVTDYGNINRVLSAGYFGHRSTSESNLYIPSKPQLVPFVKSSKKTKAEGRPVSFNFGKIPEAKKVKPSKKTPEMKEKKSKSHQGKSKHKHSDESNMSSVSRKIHQNADGTLCLVTTVSGDTTLPGVYSDSQDTASELSVHGTAKPLGESNC